ncbi:YtfJ family protein [Mannheimia varigena]|uniref:YtfJ family protein n=1 Tax=Mannheimia varigena TaxID=85404 RepID=UPI0015B579A0|nr:YtfJ family protein [Mannheimia varigena]MDY2948101.1 YtfJ family protein [Mannheimia varigena]QLD33407.1 YtfJ family protein [Mannheimia varigena]
MRKVGKLAVIFGLFFANMSFAHNVKLNQSLPAVSVAKDGELVLQSGKIAYKSWNSSTVAGKVRVVLHFAARSSVKSKNAALINTLKNAAFDPTKYQTLTIVNADDAIVGTGLFVKNNVEDGKLENPRSQVVLDQQGNVRKAWNLKEKESFIAVLDKSGKVRFATEGALSAKQIEEVINLVKTLMQ